MGEEVWVEVETCSPPARIKTDVDYFRRSCRDVPAKVSRTAMSSSTRDPVSCLS